MEQTQQNANEQHFEENMTEQEVQAQTAQNKCPSCGANMSFDIETGGLKCRHCNTTKAFDDTERVQRRQITNEILGTHSQWREGKVFRCSNCGAQEVLTERSLATKCAFCGSAQVLESDELPGIQPDSVIPFQITEQSAVERFRKWLKSRWFTPNAFKRYDIREQMSKLYTPCWSFSARTENQYQGTVGRTITTSHSRNGRVQTQTRIQWFRVRGQINHNYTDYFIQSGDRIASRNFNALKPFDLRQVKVYRQEFLSGIIAEHYTKNLEQCFNEFSNFVKRDMRTRIMRKHGADHVQHLDIRTRFHDRRFNYILLPVYINNYRYKEKTYNFFINGATGKVVGRYPRSRVKIALLVLGGLAVLGLAIWGLAASGMIGTQYGF
ncbi:MAG: hypothetical protein FWE38_00910 [Firmicutes bacterium]|nr:hypothetical protein [Bacillota bacterium]